MLTKTNKYVLISCMMVYCIFDKIKENLIYIKVYLSEALTVNSTFTIYT